MQKSGFSPRRRFVASLFALGLLFGISGCATADDASDFFLTVSRDDGYSLHKLLEHGIDPNMKEPTRGDTGLILALHEHAMKAFDVLMNAPKIDLEATANNGDNALMIASYTGNVDAVEALLAKGAEVNKHGWSALHYAASIGNAEIVKLLLDKSAYVDAESPNKTTPLMMAARSNQTDVVKLLILEGADVTLKNDQGLTAFDFASTNGYYNLAGMLKPSK